MALPTQPDIYANFVESMANGTVLGVCPPVYTAAGALTGPTEHIVRGTVSIAVGNTQTFASATVNLIGAAAFSGGATYTVVCSYQGLGTTYPPGWNAYSIGAFSTRTGPSSFVVYVENGSNATGPGTVEVDFLAIGY